MVAYIEKIKGLKRDRNALLDALHAAFRLRAQSPLKRSDWKTAAERLSKHRSTIDPLIESVFRVSEVPFSPNMREFSFDYMVVDPFFFRSGYLMERILSRTKKLSLSADEKRIIQNLLLSRVKGKALRNFRHICRLIPLIEDEGFRAAVEGLTRSPVRTYQAAEIVGPRRGLRNMIHPWQDNCGGNDARD